MKIFENFADWFKKSDEKVMALHMKKDRRALTQVLYNLQRERHDIRNLIHRLEDVLEKEAQFTKDIAETKNTPVAPEENFEEWLARVEDQFVILWEKEAEARSDAEREFVEKELPRLKAEKRRLEGHLKKLNEITAKTTILLDELNENICFELTGGHSLAAVGQALVDKFSRELREEYYLGRHDIRKFLEEYYKIDSRASREIFALLEDTGMIHYRLDLPEDFQNMPLAYYVPGTELGDSDGFEVASAMYGVWEIRA